MAEVSETESLAEGTLKALRYASTATITTQLLSRGLRNQLMQGLRPLNPTRDKMVGVAFTLRYIPAREDIDELSVFQDYDHPQRKAVESVRSGNVLVIDSRRQQRAASLGHILATRLLRRGCAGVVTDGSVRDADGFTALDLPTFAANPSANTNLIQHHAVDAQVPIGCGEVAVYPGDVLVGDVDGVVVIPRHHVDEVAEAAAQQEHLEVFVLTKIEAGSALRGVYPPDARTRGEFQEWLRGNPYPWK